MVYIKGENYMRNIVRGFHWNVLMSNGAIFNIWTPYELTRKQAKEQLMEEANGDNDIYDKSDVQRIWKTINFPK